MRGFVLSTGARDMRLPFRVPAAQQPLGHVAELRPIELACNRQHGVIRPIMLLFERKQRFTADGCNLVVRAENRTSQRMLPEIGFRQQIVDQILRRILAHRDLFQNNAALFFKFRFIHTRVEQHVAKQIHRARQVLGNHLRIVAGAFLRRERVHLTAQRVHFHGNLLRRAVFGALKKNVLYKVRQTVFLRTFIHRSRADPQTDADGRIILNGLGDDPQAV